MSVPEHLVNARWRWNSHSPEMDDGLNHVTFDLTIHNDPEEFPGRHGFYLMVGYGSINGSRMYFGIQTRVQNLASGGDGRKGLIFSRWGDRDLGHAVPACEHECWVQESGHEGDFIGVRRSYEWGEGDYRMWLAPDTSQETGHWYGVWITDLDAEETVWLGSLRFPPYTEGSPDSWMYSTVEVYGQPSIRPIDIPMWHVSIEPPEGDGERPEWVRLGYGGTKRRQLVPNADVQYIDDRVHLRVGGDVERGGETPRGYLELD